MRVAGLFAGIGGIELGFHRALGDAAETVLLCDSWEPAQSVLRHRFPQAEHHPDVRDFRAVPTGVDVLTAGFPCTDLSQAGRTAGIGGAASGLVGHVFEAMRVAPSGLPWLLIENVPNMLSLDRGRAMAYLVSELESLGYRWAYRTVDSRFTGVPQRRRRVILVASPTHDPRGVLFADETAGRPEVDYADDAFGFYWTEGRGGLGWAQDAVPTLKGGSTIGIPSPPAIWIKGRPAGEAIVRPSVEAGEELQGFPRGWTDLSGDQKRNGPRWKLVGNAVTVGVAEWVAGRLNNPGEAVADDEIWDGRSRWPSAAWGSDGKVWSVRATEFPVLRPYKHLLDVVGPADLEPLSLRASSGFQSRLLSGNLGRQEGFRSAIAAHTGAVKLS